jgi:hypothetical protein
MKIRLTVFAILVLIFGDLTSTGFSAPDPQQDQRLAAAKELEPLVLSFYNTRVKDRVSASFQNSFVSFTVAAKRYDTSYALLSLAANTNDSVLVANVPDLVLNVQPVEFLNGKITRNVGNSTTGIFKAGRSASSMENALYIISFSATALEDANAINVHMALSSAPIPQKFNLVISLSNDVRIGTGAMPSFTSTKTPVNSSGLTNRLTSRLQNVLYEKNKPKLLLLNSPQGGEICQGTCSCATILIICVDCDISHCCNVCTNPPNGGCVEEGGCYLLCDSPSC